MLVFVAISCWVLLVIAVVLFDAASTRRREHSLERAARQLGFEFAAVGKPFAGSDVHGLSILKDDADTRVADVLTGQYGGCSMLVCDVTCCNESAVNAVLTTCAAFRSPGRRLPSFQITPKDIVERVLGATAKGRGVCAGDDAFAKRFSVHCKDDLAARNLFTPNCVAYLRQHAEAFRIESSADWIVIFRPNVKTSGRDLATFINASSALASVLLPEDAIFLPVA